MCDQAFEVLNIDNDNVSLARKYIPNEKCDNMTSVDCKSNVHLKT